MRLSSLFRFLFLSMFPFVFPFVAALPAGVPFAGVPFVGVPFGGVPCGGAECVAASCAAAPPSDQERSAWLEQLATADRAADDKQVDQIATQWVTQEPTAAEPFYWRGRSRFRQGDIAGSVKDFDRYVELAPRREPSQWERGITLYYAGEYARGAKQFELYQTFDNRDVENSVWRYLCLARDQGVDKARATMLPIEGDRRVPMMTIYELYRGKKTPDDVLADARAGNPAPDILAGRLFYAHLYLGLYYEAEGNQTNAHKHINLAADKSLRTKPGVNSYMWAVADVHAKRLKQPSKK